MAHKSTEIEAKGEEGNPVLRKLLVFSLAAVEFSDISSGMVDSHVEPNHHKLKMMVDIEDHLPSSN